MRLHPDVTVSVSFFLHIFRILLPNQYDVKAYSRVLSPLCRFTSPTPTPTTNPPPALLISSPFRYRYYTRYVLTARCLSAAYLEIQQMVLYPAHLASFFAMLCPFTKSTSCAAVAACDAFISFSILFITRRLAELCFGLWQGRRMHHADGKSHGFAFLTFEDPASVNVVMIRELFLEGKAVRAPTKRLRKSALTYVPPHRLTLNVQFRARSTYSTQHATSLADWHHIGHSFPNMERLLTVRRADRGDLTFEDNSNKAQLVGKLGLIPDDKQVCPTFSMLTLL